jgi:hypothetical protein
MGKAKPDHTPEQPLEDPRWLLLTVAHHRLSERTGDSELAALQLANALQRDLRSMHLEATGKRALIPAGLWAVRGESIPPGQIRLVLYFGTDGLILMRSHPRYPKRLRGWTHVWGPDFDRIQQRKRKRAAGGGSKRKLPDDVVERGKSLLRAELIRDPILAKNIYACAVTMRDQLKLTCGAQTIARWIVKPVRAERKAAESARTFDE